jgi:secreted trypsin-like serine protease
MSGPNVGVIKMRSGHCFFFVVQLSLWVVRDFYFLALLLSVSGSVLAEEEIVGESHAKVREFHYQVYFRNTSYRCGGSIIDERHFFTAAYSVDGLSPNRLSIGSTQRLWTDQSYYLPAIRL